MVPDVAPVNLSTSTYGRRKVTMISGLYNFRDTGGTARSDGGTTAVGVLYRSDALNALDTVGEEQVAGTSIGVVVDFRTPQEREAAPDRLPETRTFRAVELPILSGNMVALMQDAVSNPTSETVAEAMASIPTLGELYVDILSHSGADLVRVAQMVAAVNDDEPTGVLVHCTAGKDRTGVAVAIILEAAGAARDAVVADYAQSQANLAGPWADGMLHAMESFGFPITPALQTLATATPPDAISAALEWTDEHHGGPANYLLSAGLTQDELNRLRKRLS
ncbi:tyrosine-protein phosphatase [Microbacterium marmarense]|uniref:Tyrosine-protein phosphatase n=1 Tax=Microbacterium marmarense TaxID=3122051 RepID=A0ABU8LQE9_9MICO